MLLKPSFERLQLAELKCVTWKTAFFILLASSSKRGEVPFLDHCKVCLSVKWTSVTLEPNASFVSKTEIRHLGDSSTFAVNLSSSFGS